MEFAFGCLLTYFGLTAIGATFLYRALKGETMDKTWYIIFKKWDEHGVTRFDELDAIECECKIDALLFAKQHYRLKRYQAFDAEACICQRDITRAKLIARESRFQDRCQCWTEADWQEFTSLPTYVGNQDKYARVRK